MQKRRRDLAADVAFMNKMVDEIVAERRKNTAAADDKKDMLAAMMTGVDRATGEQLDDVNIRYQINTFLIAGHETTSGLLSYTLYALLKHPDILKKAYEEVDRVLGPDIDARPTYQQVTRLTYITQILKEALRLWPPAPAYGISPLKDETIGGGKYKLRKNTFITILVTALHRDPSVWGPNPDAFNPENFSREAEAARPVNAWKPFGNGQRACIGRGFAMHEAALAIGMILQRFKLIDVHRYQMHLKETLTIKPEGFKIKVRPRVDKDRGAFASPAAAAAATPKAPRAPVARAGHNTPMLVLYGSNLGSAEELATRMADLAEINGFVTRLGPLDDYVGKLPEEGGVLVICASYNGAPPDNASQFVKWLGGDLPKDAFAKVRYAIFGCGNSDWAATYQSVPRFIDEKLTAHGARAVYPRGEGDARSDLDGQFQKWFPAAAQVATKEFGIDWNFTRTAEDEPLYAIEPVAQGAVNTIVTQGGAVPMKVLAQPRAAKQVRRPPVGAFDPAYRGRIAGGSELPRRRSPQRRAAQRSNAGGFGGAPLRLPAGRSDQAGGRRRPPRAIAGRQCGIGWPPAHRVRRAAAGRDPQADPDHGRAHPLPRDQAETARLYRRQRAFRRTVPHRSPVKAQIGVRPAGGASGLRAAVPPLSRNAVAAGAALLFDLVVAGRRGVALQRDHGGGGSARKLRPRYLSRRLLELSRRPPCRRYRPCHRQGDQGRLPASGRQCGADHHDRARHGAGAVPRLPAGTRRSKGQGRDAGAGDAVLRLPPSRAGFPLCR